MSINSVAYKGMYETNDKDVLSDFEIEVKGDIAYWCQANNIDYNEEAIKIYWKEKGYTFTNINDTTSHLEKKDG